MTDEAKLCHMCHSEEGVWRAVPEIESHELFEFYEGLNSGHLVRVCNKCCHVMKEKFGSEAWWFIHKSEELFVDYRSSDSNEWKQFSVPIFK